MSFNPDAAIDVLFFLGKAGEREGQIFEADIHLLAYLGCCLWNCNGGSLATWGYKFTATPDGSPFATALMGSIEECTEAGIVRRNGRKLVLVGDVRELGIDPALLAPERISYLDAANESTLLLPLGAIRHILRKEPTLAAARTVDTSRYLLEGLGNVELQSQLKALRQVGATDNLSLFALASLWLVWLAEQSQPSLQPSRGRQLES